jgi:hypothetical protein
MTQNPGIEALRQLAHIGYKFRLEGEAIKAKYHGPGRPDPVIVSPLLEVARKHKHDVRFFLKFHCPLCGGIASCPDHIGKPICLACDWEYLVQLYPDSRAKQ